MNVKILELGFFEKFCSTKQTDFLYQNRIIKFYENSIFHFDLLIEFKDSYNIIPEGGYFIPSKTETLFYQNFDESLNFPNVIDRNPKFFAFLIPYPFLKRINEWSNHPSENGAYNIKPFKNGMYNYELKEKRFNYSTLLSDLKGKVIVAHPIDSNSRINDFIDNNCYPIFIESHEELVLIMNDFALFYKKILNIDLTLKSFSKIIVPFFELDEKEANHLSSLSPSLFEL